VEAPLYGGFIDESIGWRWIKGIQGLANLPLLALICIFLRETRGVTLHKRAKQFRTATGDERYRSEMDLEAKDIKEMLHNSSVKAIHMLLAEPFVFSFGIWIGLRGQSLSSSSQPFPSPLKRNVVGVRVLGDSLTSRSVSASPRLHSELPTNTKIQVILRTNDRKILPESRLCGAMCGAAFLPVGIYIYSFTQHGYLTWVGPTKAQAQFQLASSSYSSQPTATTPIAAANPHLPLLQDRVSCEILSALSLLCLLLNFPIILGASMRG
jgi:hypothetical protein